MKEFLQNIFIFISEKELILPFYIVIIMISSMKSIYNFMKLGVCDGGNPNSRRINLTYFFTSFLLFIESIIFLILNLLKIKEIIIFKISLIVYLITVWYPYVRINKGNDIKKFIEDISAFFIYHLDFNFIKNKNLERKRNLEIKEIIKDIENENTKRD